MKKLAFIIIFAFFTQSTVSAQSCLPDGITFTTQAEIDNFQTNNPNCTEIEGDVLINGGDIVNLNGLSVLTSIAGSLFIGTDYYNNPSITSLTGLDNVMSIGGDLSIGGIDSLTSLTGLDNVMSIGGDIDIKYNHALTSLTGLEGLTSMGGDLSIGGNNALTSLTGHCCLQ